jgi:imidazole glycerol-phosphate synthase subunit HisH
MNISVIDMGNIFNLQRAISFVGGQSSIIRNIDDILQAKKIILPGVGNFKVAMELLRNKGYDEAIIEKANEGVPILGICLGQQLLMESSEESELTQGLGLIPGEVKYFYNNKLFDDSKVPNIGWRPIIDNKESLRIWDDSILKGVVQNDQCYFVHSLYTKTSKIDHTLSLSNYGGVSFSSTVQYENIIGCQFHPEKSGNVGLKILKNYINI